MAKFSYEQWSPGTQLNKLSDVIRLWGDLPLYEVSVDGSSMDEVPTVKLEAYLVNQNESKKEKTVQDVFDELTDEQKKVVYYLIGEAIKEEKGETMHNTDALDACSYAYNYWTPTGTSVPSNACIGYSPNTTTTDRTLINTWGTSQTQELANLLAKYNTCPQDNNDNEKTKGDSIMAMFNGMFGKAENGLCRLSMNGSIAVKTSNGYKTYDMESKRLVNCSNFVFNIGEEFFFVIPTNKVEIGDIILVNGKPKCVISSNTDTITVINYEDSTIDQMLPERHVFMGNTYFYGKIVSMFGNDNLKGDKAMKKIMSYVMLSELMKSNGGKNDMSSMLPLMMLSGGNFGDMFGDIFNFSEEDDCSDIEDGAKVER